MDFISSIFVAVASFFGFSDPEPKEMVQPVPLAEEVVVDSELSVDMDQTMGSNESIEVGTNTNIDTNASTIPATNMIGDEIVAAPKAIPEPLPPPTPIVKTMIVAGGCFWCVEADLEKLPGVIEVVSGYSGGSTDSPTYQTYGSGGHREVVEVTYDATQVSFEDILIVTMKTTDPTDDDGTFADRGDKYSSAFYYETDEQKTIIENLIKEVDEFGPYDKPLAIDVEKRAKFWKAEDSHQDYYKGTLTKLKYGYYRSASGRDDLIIKYWGANDHSTELSWRKEKVTENKQVNMWINYTKPGEDELKKSLDDLTFRVTQDEGTERAGSSPLDKNWEDGIYVDILSGEPLYSSKDKFDSGTGWPSFVRPITPDAVTERVDKKLFTTRTEIRSVYGDNHLGHVFNDGPKDSTGLRYCMNGVSLKFIPKAEMEAEGYGDFLQYL